MTARVLTRSASEEADRLGAEWWIGCEHMLLGLLADERSSTARVLARNGVDLETARAATGRMSGSTEGMQRPEWSGKKFTPRATVVLKVAEIEAERLGAHAPQAGHHLLALLTEGRSLAVAVLLDLGVDLKRLRAEVLEALQIPPDTRDRYVRERELYLSGVGDGRPPARP